MTSHLFVHVPSLLSDSHTGTTVLCLHSDPLTAESRRGRRAMRRRRTQSLLVSCNSHIPLSHTQTQFILCTASCGRQDGDGRVGGGEWRVEVSNTLNLHSNYSKLLGPQAHQNIRTQQLQQGATYINAACRVIGVVCACLINTNDCKKVRRCHWAEFCHHCCFR